MTENLNPATSFDPQEFDQWADGYDEEVGRATGFPFEGYHAVLDEMMHCARIITPQRVLDLGTGTGNLALRFAALDCEVWGTDFSHEMLAKARLKFPPPAAARFLYWDMREPWPAELPGVFDRIVSAYTLHHINLDDKVELLGELMAHLSPGGRIVMGDLSFETLEKLDQARRQYGAAWDEEYYWVADEVLPALAQAGWRASYRQISGCAGVYCIQEV